MIKAGIVPLLFESFSVNDIGIVESSSRAFRILLQNATQIEERMVSSQQFPALFSALLKLLAVQSLDLSNHEWTTRALRVSEMAASIIARTAFLIDDERVFTMVPSALSLLTKYLDDCYSFYPKLQEAALDALASLCKDRISVSNKIAEGEIPSPCLFQSELIR